MKTIENAVFNGIRKTINRFREQPFLYFTESDIHASLSKDIMEGNSDLFIIGKDKKDRTTVKVPVSLVHHEYPTNFRYESKKLKDLGYTDDEIDDLTDLKGKHGDRGNYDLAILNKTFIEKLFSEHQNNLMNAMKHIINKDNEKTKIRTTNEEVLFAIEVKFLNPFNSTNSNMATEVTKDNHKLNLALKSSNNFIKPINLVFCSSDKTQLNGRSIIKEIKDYLKKETHSGVCSIFIESFFLETKGPKNTKTTVKPIFEFTPNSSDKDWAADLKTMLK